MSLDLTSFFLKIRLVRMLVGWLTLLLYPVVSVYAFLSCYFLPKLEASPILQGCPYGELTCSSLIAEFLSAVLDSFLASSSVGMLVEPIFYAFIFNCFYFLIIAGTLIFWF